MRQRDSEAGTLKGRDSELFNAKPREARGNREETYDSLLTLNFLLFMIDWVKDAPEDACRSKTRAEMRSRLENIILHCEATRNKHFEWYARLLRNHIEGIVTFADYHVTNGVVEGINQRTKTIRRKSYGLSDDEYFLLKVVDSSHKGDWMDQSHKI